MLFTLAGVPVKTDTQISELERLANFRFEALIELGLSPDDAMGLMYTLDIVHTARKLVDQGCPPGLVSALLED